MEACAALGTELIPLPMDATAIFQPLDIGVMGSFKKKLRLVSLSAELGLLRRDSEVPVRERL